VDENFIHLEEIDRVVAGNRGTLRTRGTAHTPDGRPYNNTYLHLFRVEGGQFVEYQVSCPVNSLNFRARRSVKDKARCAANV